MVSAISMPTAVITTSSWLLMCCGIVWCTQALWYVITTTTSTTGEDSANQKKKVITTATGRKVSVVAPSESTSSSTAKQVAPLLGILLKLVLGGICLLAHLWIVSKHWNEEGFSSPNRSQYLLFTLVVVLGTIYYLQNTSGITAPTPNTSTATKDATTKTTSNVMEPQLSEEEYFNKHLIQHPNPSNITHMDILFCVATCPELLRSTQEFLIAAEEQKNRKQQLLLQKQQQQQNDSTTANTSARTTTATTSIELDDFGWADDTANDDDDGNNDQEQIERAKKLKLFEAEKELEKQRMADLIVKKSKEDDESSSLLAEQKLLSTKFEDLDEGVLGQKWVEQTLQFQGVDVWPPSNINGTFNLDSVMDHPASRRNVCMLLARLYSQMLNTHPALVEAGPKGLVDHTYFSHSAQYRPRFISVMESILLRLALVQNSYPLAKTIIEAISMFKIGVKSAVDKKSINWFNGVLLETYGGIEGLPRLKITDPSIQSEKDETATPNDEQGVIATKDTVVLSLTIERTHAQKFLEHKLTLCKSQHLDPQMVLASYHEVWWVLVSVQNEEQQNQKVPLIAFPFIVRNIAQKIGKVKCKFTAPGQPGRYKFLFDVKSPEFLGADQSFELEYVIVGCPDNSDDDEEEGETDDEEEEEEEDEGKKEK